jgi:hypothetical protein
MMLWAARGVYPECMAGLSQLTRVLAYPSIEAWKAAMHMIQWMYLHRERGIVFSQQGNDEAITFSDASNKADEIDGKCMYGHVLMFKGGPIGGVSKKLVHIGNSAFHNEYMALRYAANITMWFRQLMSEIGCTQYIRQPTLMYVDNKAANLLCNKDFISTGNQYIFLAYFWIKELVKLGHIRTRYVSTLDNLADLFTKPVTKQVVVMLVDKLCGVDLTWANMPNTPEQDISLQEQRIQEEIRIELIEKYKQTQIMSELNRSLEPTGGDDGGPYTSPVDPEPCTVGVKDTISNLRDTVITNVTTVGGLSQSVSGPSPEGENTGRDPDLT